MTRQDHRKQTSSGFKGFILALALMFLGHGLIEAAQYPIDPEPRPPSVPCSTDLECQEMHGGEY